LLWEVPQNHHILENQLLLPQISCLATFVLWKRFSRFSSHNHIQHVTWPEQKILKLAAYRFRYCKHCEHYQDAKFEATASRNSLYYEYKSYDGKSTYLYTFSCCSSSILCNNSNCMLWIVKKGGAICKKMGTLLVSS